MPQDLVGSIVLSLNRDGAGETHARLVRTRSLQWVSALVGMPADGAIERLPLILSICRESQAAAARAALAGSRGAPLAQETRSNLGRRVQVESLFESLRALALSWPGRVGVGASPAIRHLRPAAERAHAELSASELSASEASAREDSATRAYAQLGAELIFGPRRRLPADASELSAWARLGETPTALFVGELLDSGWAAAGPAEVAPLREDALPSILAALVGAEGAGFAAAPELDGSPRETGATARHRDHPLVVSIRDPYGPGLLSRVAARLVEASSLIDELEAGGNCSEERVRARSLADGWGVGVVESARGLLVHALRLEGDRVAELRILPPTEWNFGPRGSAVQSLGALGAELNGALLGSAQPLAELVVGSFDPCVGLEVQIDAKEIPDA